MQATDVIKMARILTATPAQNQGRWTDSNVLSIVDMAQKHAVQELLFPESRLTFITTTAQYNPLPDTHRLYRVYLNGRIIVETPGNIATLEGRQIGLYDNTGTGVEWPGTDGPLGGGGSGQPQWVVQTPLTYPFLGAWGSPAPMTQPSFIGQRARYYRRGGGIGITPAQAAGSHITIDGVFVPPTLASPTDQLEVPSNYLDYLAWYTVLLMKFADDTQATQDQRNFAEGKAQEHLRKLRTWVRQYSLDSDKTLVRNDRGQYRIGGNRIGDNW
jgi:hypothetical protein